MYRLPRVRPNNLTGSGDHRNLATGYWPIHVDEKGRRLLFMDARTPAILAFHVAGPSGGRR